MRSLRNAVLLGSLAFVWLCHPAVADFPDRPVTIIVPFTAGGPTDVVARLIGEHMSRTLGQPFLIENIGGVGGTLGMTRAALARPDGYTIAIGNTGTQAAAPALYPGLKYDPAKSFAQIGIVSYTPQAIVARKSMAPATLKDFLAFLSASSAKQTYAHSGVGSVSHVSGLLFNTKYGFTPTLVPYRGTGPALHDLVAEQIDYMIDQSLNVIPQIKAGTIKAYAIAATARLQSLPDIPTTVEGGSDFIFSAWNAMVAPAETPQDVVAKLADALSQALESSEVQTRLSALGTTVPQPADRGPPALQKFIESEVGRITPVIKAAGVVAN